MRLVGGVAPLALLPALSAWQPRAPAPWACITYSAKAELLRSVEAYAEAIAADGIPSVDFGVAGGELDRKTRAPRDLAKAGAFYAVSDRVGLAADQVLAAVDAVAIENPTAEPTRSLGTCNGESCPLHGTWRNIFTTAADAVFSPDSRRGGANVSNIIDAVKGRITNVIDFLPRDHPAFHATRQKGNPPPLASLRVRLSATATSTNRVELIFRMHAPALGVAR